jgi:type II secretory pathway component PulM
MKITGRDKRVLIAGGVVVVLVALFYAWTSLVQSPGELDKEVESKKRVLIREREMIGQENLYKARLDQYRKRFDQDMGRLLTGTTPALAGAELQNVLSDLAAQNGVEISRKTARSEQKVQENLIKVSANIETNCTPDQLIQFLAAIENYPKFLTVDELNIMTIKLQRKSEIRPVITVAGYITSPEAKPDKTGR